MKKRRPSFATAFNRSRQKSRRQRARDVRGLKLEMLEARQLLALTAWAEGGSESTNSNYLIVAADQGDDIYLQRRADGQLLVDSASSFTTPNLDTFATPDTIFVTSGGLIPNSGAMYPGDNRSPSEGGPGVNSQFITSQSTTFPLGRSIIIRDSAFQGTLSHGGRSWQISGLSSTGVATIVYNPGENPGSPQSTPYAFPVSANLFRGTAGNDQVGHNLVTPDLLQVVWSRPVATIDNNAAIGNQAVPVITRLDYNFNQNGDGNETATEFNIQPGVGISTSFRYDLGPNSVGIVPGSVRGTITFPNIAVPSVSTGIVQRTSQSIDFWSDITTGRLHFARPFGQFRINYDGGNADTFAHNDPALAPYGAPGLIGWGDAGTIGVRGLYDSSSGEISLFFRNGNPEDVDQGVERNKFTQPFFAPQVTLEVEAIAARQDPSPTDFTVFAGHDLPSQLSVDLLTPGSTVNIDSPVIVSQPSNPLSSRADIRIAATTINISAPVQSQDSFIVAPSSGLAVTERLNLDAAVAIPGAAYITLGNDTSNDTNDNSVNGPNRGRMTVSPSGSLSGTLAPTPADVTTSIPLVVIEASESDIVLEGILRATNMSIYMNSPQASDVKTPFYFTTRSLRSGADTGVLWGTTVSVTLSNAAPTPVDGSIAYNVVDLRTRIDSLRIRAGSDQTVTPPIEPSPSGPYPVYINIREDNSISFDAVASTTLPIDVVAQGNIAFRSALHSWGDITVKAEIPATPIPPPPQFNPGGGSGSGGGSGDPSEPPTSGGGTTPPTSGGGTTPPTSGGGSGTTPGGGGGTTAPPRVLTEFEISAPISSRYGRIAITADSLKINNTLTVIDASIDDRADDVTLTATSGDVNVAGVITAINNVRLIQSNEEGEIGKIFGATQISAGKLFIDAEGTIGDPSVLQTDAGFYLRTKVRELTAEAQYGINILEADDIFIPSLRNRFGITTLVAMGVDPAAAAGGHTSALQGAMQDVTQLFASAPNGSIDLVVDTSRMLNIGSPAALLSNVTDGSDLVPMEAAGNVTLRSVAGPITVLDAPIAGGTARSVRVASTADLPGTYLPGNGGQTASTLVGSSLGSLVIDGVQLQRRDRVLLKNQLRPEQNGIYEVESSGGATTSWRLKRSVDSDTREDLLTNTLVRVEQGSASARSFYQLSVGAGFIGVAPISVRRTKLTTNIGTDLSTPERVVTFRVSSDGGTNSSAGSLGKMLLLRQQNDTSSSSLNPEQAMAFSMPTLPNSIELTQELPLIEQAVAIIGNGNLVDGSRIAFTREGNVVTSLDEVNGFEFVASSGAVRDGSSGLTSGASLERINVGGFVQGSAVKVDGASDILVNGVVLGRNTNGDRLGNDYGVRVTGESGSATVLNSVIVSSNLAGISAEGDAAPITVVGTTVGSQDQNNQTGIVLGNTLVQAQPAGVSANALTGDFDGDGLTDFAERDATGLWKITRGLQAGGYSSATTWGHWSSGISWEDIRVGDFNGDGLDDIAGRTGNGAWWIAESTGSRFANRWAGVWSHLAGWQDVLVGDFNGDGLDDIVGRSARNAWWGGITSVSSGVPKFTNRLMGIWSIAVNWSDGIVGDFNGDGLADIAASANGAAWWIGESSGTGFVARRHGSASPAAGSEAPTSGLSANRIGVRSLENRTFEVRTAAGQTLLPFPTGVNAEEIYVGQAVVGDGLSGNSRILSIDSSSRTILLSEEMTKSSTTRVSFGEGGRNFVQDNRRGLQLLAGATAMTNTTVTRNTFSGIDISGGDYSIGLSEDRSSESNAIYKNGRWGINFAALAVPDNPQQDRRKVQGNYLGIAIAGAVEEPNVFGNIGVAERVAPLSLGLAPDTATGIDSFGNRHGIGEGGGGGTPPDDDGRPNPPPTV